MAVVHSAASVIERVLYFLGPAHLAKFEAYVRKWQAKLGLQDWEVFVMMDDVDSSDEYRARVTWDIDGSMATVILGRDWAHCKPTNTMLDRVAFHEMCHLLLAKFRDDCERNTKPTQEAADASAHLVIRRLENFVLGLDPN